MSSCPAAAAAVDSRLTWRIGSDFAQVKALVPAWHELLGDSASNEPVLSPDWMLTWWRIFGGLAGRQLRIAAFFRGDRLVGLAPLLRRRAWYRPGIPFRRLEPLGTGEEPADAIHPDYLSIITARGLETQVVGALADALVQGAFGPWDELLLPRMAGDNPLVPLLAEALRRRGLACSSDVMGTAAHLSLPASWDDYLAQLSSSRRAYIRQSLRRFEQWAGVAANEAVSAPDDLAWGARTLADLHQQRWGAEGKFGSSRFTAFHETMLPILRDAGALQLLFLNAHGEPIAALYNILWNGKVYFYQSGRKLDLPAAIRPGIVLHAHAIRDAIEAGRSEYDFLSGGEHYKQQLALATRSVIQLRATRACLAERARVIAEVGIDGARRVRNAARGIKGRVAARFQCVSTPPAAP